MIRSELHGLWRWTCERPVPLGASIFGAARFRLRLAVPLLLIGLAGGPMGGGFVFGQTPVQFQAARELLVEQLVAGGDLTNPRVIASLRATPRHEFIPAADRGMAYYDMSLPIGNQQTISSPFIVGFMTEALDPHPGDRVLEIGTGSGYQSAILSPLVGEVYTIEIIEPLAARAQRTLRRLGYANVHVRAGDGFQGWPEHAPFDKIIVTCSPDKVPKALVEQLAEGGRMVIPVGERHQQTLYLYQKVGGKLKSEPLRPTLFVPMLGQAYVGREEEWEKGEPVVVNGDFSEPLGKAGFVPGWYYQRQFSLSTAAPAPDGGQYVAFHNETLARPSHLLQGLALDGSKVARLRLSAWVRVGPLVPNPSPEMQPNVLLRFFDGQRREISYRALGPLRPTGQWVHLSQVVRVPPQTREAIVHIGLFGAVGEASFDGIQVEVVR